MAKIYYDQDADLNVLKNKKIAIIGYGIQGRGQGLNLRDSGVSVIVSELPGTKNYDLAVQDGFKPMGADEATKQADIIQILTQDHLQAQIYEKFIAPNLKAGKALLFSHGFNIHYGYIKPPKDIDVIMVAPKGPGSLVRSQFVAGGGVPCLVAVEQNASKNALKLAMAHAKAVGGTRAGVIQTTFKEETETDLFGEQVVLCGGLTELIRAGFDTLVEAGYQPEMAYFECLHEVKLITDAVFVSGIGGMHRRVSDTAEYGDYSRGKRVITKETRKEMKKILKEVQNGKFAKEWIDENKTGRKNFDKMRKEADNHPIEKVGESLRKMMPWIEGGKKI
ncbi:MAG: ketol-acid reductoisomerase [Omnitrophica bacterium RIFCSPLOWO2_12_FULL_44_17]|uniref:Ketol-acid reductoisomerase (NADP(+)) n=1 Tax=Candidatus Danuiimicrobium aquiferis TaxID=1801832 RepID=A0A1G1L228_9BACT|nr:MAG: ketol-acid reductoisomerase [Omnitrophica bacterium RIFCSPHIGHO2_02_FULL_45_28]OGW92487.1 MAG: ketol-acid reductoisomerase [Omnitrophica bacterium RIFCSPHIGHO2_12_FULL_44_12]OGW99207.1 MAG: ketol-acid reductoisomerase [Omnitrophica bacterium RIFCSPLOWO2_12_FULL_44_17]